MRVYLDDKRSTPSGWMGARWPEEVIELLKTGEVTMISLDHDLGMDSRTGYDVLLWIEKAVFTRGFEPPQILIHTANPSAKRKMEAAVKAIMKKAEHGPQPVPCPTCEINGHMDDCPNCGSCGQVEED